MPLLTLADAELSYGDVPLLDGASFALEQGERVGLIGRTAPASRRYSVSLQAACSSIMAT